MPDPTKPLKISDLSEFNRRQLAYNDSLAAYNQSVDAFNSLGEVRGGIGVNSFDELPQAVWRHRGDSNNTPGWVHMSDSHMGDYVSIYDNNTTPRASDSSVGVPANLGDPSITTHIMPTVVAEAKGNKFMNFYPKPKQPVEYQPRPSYQQIPTSTKTPIITPIQQAIHDELSTTTIPNITPVAKDIQRYTAGNYLESQGKPSGYVNYGEGEGRKDIYADGGVRGNDPIKGNTTSVNNLGTIPDNYLEDIIAKDLLIQENNRLASNYAKANPSNVREQPINNDKIDYSNTDNRRYGEGYVGNPNWSFAAPNMRGKQRADAEAYHGDLIGGELLGLGIEKLASKAYGAYKGISRNRDLSKALSTDLDGAVLNPDLIEGILPKVKQSSLPSSTSSDNLILDSKKIKAIQDDIDFTQKAEELQSKVPLTRVVDKSNLVVKDGKLFNSAEPYTVMTGEGLTNTTSARNTSHWSYGHVGDPGHGNWKGKSTAVISDYETLSKKGYALDLDPTDTFFYNSKNMELPEGSLILTRDKKLYDDIIKNTNQKNVKYFPSTTNDEFESIVNSYGKREGDETGKDLFEGYLEKNWKEGKDIAHYKPASNYKPVQKNVYNPETGMYYQVEDSDLRTIGSPFGGGSSKMHSNSPLYTIEKAGNYRLSKDVFDLYPDNSEFKDLLAYPKEIQLSELEKYKSLKRRKSGSKSIAELENAMAKNSGFDSYSDFKKSIGEPKYKNGGIRNMEKYQEGGVRDGDPPTKKIYKEINDYKIAKDAFVDSTNAYNYGLSFWDNNKIDPRNKMILYKDDPLTGSRYSDPAARHARYYNTDNYKAQPIGTNRIDLTYSDGTPAYQKPKTQPFYMPAPTGNYDNPDVRPVTEIKMPDGMWTKEKFINRYGEKVWNEQHPPKKLGNGGVLEGGDGDEDSNSGMTGMMKARIALDSHFGNTAAQRMTSPNPKTGMTPEGLGTHYMGSYGEYAVPLLQDTGKKNLEYIEKPTKEGEKMKFESSEDAKYFAEHYKEVAPMMYENGGVRDGDPNEEVYYGGMLPEVTVEDKLPLTNKAYLGKLKKNNPIAYAATSAQNEVGESIMESASYLPGVGEVVDAAYLGNDLVEGNWGNLAVGAGLAALPFVGYGAYKGGKKLNIPRIINESDKDISTLGLSGNDVKDIAQRTKDRLMTDKFIANNMNTTGRTRKEVEKSIDNFSKEFNNSTITFKDLDDINIGAEYIGNGKININTQNLTNKSRESILGDIEHETEHLFSDIFSNKAAGKGSHFGLYKNYPKLKLSDNLRGKSMGNIPTHFYESLPQEQQVRFRKAIRWMEDHADLKMGDDITDDQVKTFGESIKNWSKADKYPGAEEFLGSGKFREAHNIFSEIDLKSVLGEGEVAMINSIPIGSERWIKTVKDVLNKAYVGVPAAVGGAALQSQQENPTYANGGVINNDQIQGKAIDSFYTPKQSKAMGTNMSYPRRTLENPSYGNIRINPPQYHNPNVIREMRMEKRLSPSNIPTNSSFNKIDNNDIGFLFNESFGIQ